MQYLVLFVCVAVVSGEPLTALVNSTLPPPPPGGDLPSPVVGPLRYHERIGVPEAARIRAAETSRVAGSLASYLGEHKFFAGLVISLSSGQTSVCGGSLVSNTRVLTAASCYHDGFVTASSVLVVLGSVRLFSGGTRVVAPYITLHPQYNSRFLENNIAVLTIPYVATSSYIKPISMATTNLSYVGYRAEIIGFGRTSPSSAITASQGLRDAFVSVISNAVCQQSYGAMVEPEHVCTSGALGRGACGGDAGGPLILYSNAGNDVLIGVVNYWSANGCASGYPTGHTRVGHHYSWIRAQL